MGNHEFLQAAPQLAHQAKELLDLGSKVNLVQTLTDLGHPYGLLLGQSTGSSGSLLNFFFPPEKGATKARFKNSGGPTEGGVGMLASSSFSSPEITSAMIILGASQELWPASKPFLKSTSVNSLFIESSQAMFKKEGFGFSASLEGIGERSAEKDNKMEDFGTGLIPTALSKSSILGSGKLSPESARKIHMEQLFAQQVFLVPTFLKLFAGENFQQERLRGFVVGRNRVELGTTAIKLAAFQGEKPFVVKSSAGQEVAVVNPGDPIGSIHVSHQARFLRTLPLIEKAKAIRQDFIDLLKGIDQPNGSLLTVEQQETVGKARQATLIGISHLVRLFRAGTGMPTWNLEVLPELVQRFHQHDSQVVSTAFGGQRKVGLKDVEMMVLTPAMRQELAAAW